MDEIAARVRKLSNCDAKREAIEILRSDYASVDSLGPVRAARFFGDVTNEEIRADALRTETRIPSSDDKRASAASSTNCLSLWAAISQQLPKWRASYALG